MYLKRIELHGFKSFADRVELEFQPGINVIVGPNGTGKSNIIDAIRWVLGEQSIKNLRGYKLEDVIFAGSNLKKPMGMAEVALTLDNSDRLIPLDYSEISFIRRTFRSGESEFFLNKVPCRLKDIQEILLDSGVGKAGYSVISQGQIDEVLACRPEERRIIFEEAAGISKHKIRKQEAEKKLEETVDNISRLDDVIAELLNQLEPLAQQRDTALKYKELTLVYKKLDINLLLSERESRQDRLKHIIDELERNQISLNELHNLIKSIKQKITEYKSKQSEIETAYEKAQDEFYHLDSQLKELNKDLEMAAAEKARLESANSDFTNSIGKHKNDLATSRESLKLKADILEEKIKVINQLELAIEEKEKNLLSLNNLIKEKQNVIESAQNEVIDILNHVSEKKNTISKLDVSKANLQKRLNQIESEIVQIDEANNATTEEISCIHGEIDCLKSSCNELEQNTRELVDKKNKIAAELDNNGKIVMQKQQELTIITSRLRTLKEVDENYEGYQYGVKNLLIALKKKQYYDSGIYGSVADLISVDQNYEVAIETALGSAMQNIICETEENAKMAIDFLKRNNCGRATFLPLTTVKPRLIEKNEEQYLSIKGCIGSALELITFDKKYFAPLAYLLGRVIVSESLDDAVNIAKRSNFAFKVVTVQGDVISPGGSITGGSQKRSNFLLSRKRQINDCERQIKELETELMKLKQLEQKLRDEINEKQKLIEDNTQSLYVAKSQLEVLKKQLQEKQNVLAERRQREKILNEEKVQIQREIQEIVEEIAVIENDIGQIDIQHNSAQSVVKSLQEEIEKIKEDKEGMSEEITQLKIQLASYKQEQVAIIQSMQAIEENIRFSVDEIKKYQEKVEHNNEALALIEKKLADYENKIEDLIQSKKQHQELLDFTREQRDMLKFSLDKAQEELNKLEKQQHQVETKLHNLHIQEATIKIEINQIDNQLYEKYSITFEDAVKFKEHSSSNIEDIKKQLASLKEQIESLGPVNMKAIEDYENLRSRYEFLVSQRDDLIKAKANLDSMIKDVTGAMEKMLLSAINKINEEFNKVFTELFEGGRAELIIESDGSILDCGIEVKAQPPGKKLQNISLLSGGERALTAIALLFAILNTKATPFCVLDEIEAALDDVNISRFTRYLKKVSKHTQFILITHRKPTMEIADALYGISMEETAVSKVLAVKMV